MVKICFICGYGRSGSTLLDKMISQLDDLFFSLGEFHYLWERGLGENQICECERPLQSCSFWAPVLNDAYSQTALPDGKEIDFMRTRMVSIRNLLPLLRPGHPHEGLDTYASHLGRVMDAAHKASDKVLIDSSKNPLHGFTLLRRENVGLHVVHLIRDIRAVAYSWKKRAKWRPEAHTHFPSRGYLNSCAGWAVSNMLAEKLGHYAASYRVIKYEDLVSSPATCLPNTLMSVLGQEQAEYDLIDQNDAF